MQGSAYGDWLGRMAWWAVPFWAAMKISPTVYGRLGRIANRPPLVSLDSVLVIGR